MNELVDLESRPNPTLVQRYRIQSIHNVVKDLEAKMNEIESQKMPAKVSKARKVQEESQLTLKSAEASKPKQVEVPQEVTVSGKSGMMQNFGVLSLKTNTKDHNF